MTKGLNLNQLATVFLSVLESMYISGSMGTFQSRMHQNTSAYSDLATGFIPEGNSYLMNITGYQDAAQNIYINWEKEAQLTAFRITQSGAMLTTAMFQPPLVASYPIPGVRFAWSWIGQNPDRWMVLESSTPTDSGSFSQDTTELPTSRISESWDRIGDYFAIQGINVLSQPITQISNYILI